MERSNNNPGRILKQRRIARLLTLEELAAASGVSSEQLGPIETGECFPSVHILHKIAKPLGFDEDKLITLAGISSPQTPSVTERNAYLHIIIPIDSPLAQSILPLMG